MAIIRPRNDLAYQNQDLGASLGTGLQTLAQAKMQQFQQKQQRSQMASGLAALNIPPEKAHQIAMLSPELQQLVVKNYLQGAEGAGLDQALGNIFGGGQEQAGTQAQGGLPQAGSKSFAEILKNPRLNPEHRLKVAELQQRKQIAEQKSNIAERKQQHAEQKEINTRLNPQITALEKGAEAAKKDNISYNTLRQAINSGKLTSATYARFRHAIDKNAKTLFGGLGTALGAAVGSAIPGAGTFAGATVGGGLGTAAGSALPEFVGNNLDQVFNKTVYGFLRNAREIFGANFPIAEMDAFLKTLPTLQMDNPAKLAIIDQMEATGKLAQEQDKAKNQIIRENGGKAPSNLFELVYERTEPMLKKIASDLNDTIKRVIDGEL